MGFNLEHYSTTFQDTNKANRDHDLILNKYPFICSREALYNAIKNSGVVDKSQRNPNGYTVKQMTDKIVAHWDKVMFQHWDKTLSGGSTEISYNNPRAFQTVLDRWNWSQPEFWAYNGTSFIALDVGSTGSKTAAEIVAATDIILLPELQYTINTTIYQQKPFLAFDDRAYFQSGNSSTAELIGTDDFGVELDVDGNKRVTGITSSGTTDDPTTLPASSEYMATLLHVWDYQYYHDDLNVNGSNFAVNPAYTGHDVLDTSTKWYDLRRAKFSVTTSGGVVTAITPVARNDGDGVARTGGWDYLTTTDDYYELYFIKKQPLTNSQIIPRVLFRTNSSADNGEGQKATVDITATDSEFHEGLGIDSTYIDTAYAIPSRDLADVGHSHSIFPQSEDTKHWTQRNWPSGAFNTGIDPAVVRILSERPSLQTTSRSLKTTTVGTGAHRFRFEFEYPAMDEAEAQPYIEKFESFKGNTLPMQLYIPSQAIQHVGNWSSNNSQISDWAPRLNVENGVKGADTIILGGHSPGGPRIPDGNFFFTSFGHKIYQIVGAGMGNPDQYGRVSYLVEPPLVKLETGSWITLNHKNNFDSAKNYFLVKAFLEDSTLDYTVDAAGIYRMTFRFRECLE